MERLSFLCRPLCAVLLSVGATLAAPALAQVSTYTVQNLVSDGSIPANFTDPNLKNGWGVAFNPTAYVWVSNNHTGTSTLYDGTGLPQSLVVTIPPAPGGTMGAPTGLVYNGSADLVVTNGTLSGPSRFLFCTEDGTISGWAPNVDRLNALVAVNNPGANYKGLAIASTTSGTRLYAADFHNARIDVFDKTFAPVVLPNAFMDKMIPSRYAPFNITAIGSKLYVAYAKRDRALQDEVAGPGLGFVDVFNTDGKRLMRLVKHTGLNAPWGMAMASANFGQFSNALLVGNFGDGTVSAYDPATGAMLGSLSDATGTPLKVDGLWGMQFGNGFNGQSKDSLYFAAGPYGENGGLYGSISVAP